MSDTYDWNALAEQAERGQLRPIEGTTLKGEEAAARGTAMLLAATGTTSIEDATHVALGRPRLGEVRDHRVWRVRTTAELDEAVIDLANREGRTRSEVIRAAVAEYAQAHA